MMIPESLLNETYCTQVVTHGGQMRFFAELYIISDSTESKTDYPNNNNNKIFISNRRQQ